MNEVSLQLYLTRLPSLTEVVFPSEERFNSAAEFKQSIDYEEKEACQANVLAAEFLLQYLDEIENLIPDTWLYNFLGFEFATNMVANATKTFLFQPGSH